MNTSCSILISFFLVVGHVVAADTYRIEPGQTLNISEHTICSKVTNSCVAAIMVPTKTAAEWTSFRNNSAACATKAACDPIVAEAYATLADTTVDGNREWQSPFNATALDNVASNISAMVGGEISTPLSMRQYGFSIPSAAVIRGIEITLYKRSLSGVGIQDLSVYLMKASAPVGSNNARIGENWAGGGYASYVYGGATDLWGTTWTPAEINNAGFGLYLLVRYASGAGNDHPYVDAAKIKIIYE